jgi:hypothetical protein
MAAPIPKAHITGSIIGICQSSLIDNNHDVRFSTCQTGKGQVMWGKPDILSLVFQTIRRDSARKLGADRDNSEGRDTLAKSVADQLAGVAAAQFLH